MSTSIRRTSVYRYLPHALAATGFVIVVPLAIVGWLEAHGLVHTPVVSLGLGVGLSWATGLVGSAVWMRHPRSSDIVFADLMIWGWLRRERQQRRIMETSRLLAGTARGALRGHPKERLDLLRRLAADLEVGDPYTHGHSRRVARHAAMTAKVLGLDDSTVDLIRTAAVVHDVGKLEVPKGILNKAGRLTDEEFAAIRKHPGTGAEMVATIGNPELTAIVRSHHERLDGDGYPDGLAGDNIPFGARIVAVCDTFDAISSSRPYRPASQHKKAIDVLKKESGTQLDGKVVEAFMRYYSGRRSLAWWLVLVNFPQRLIGRLGGSMRLNVQGALNSVTAVGTAIVGGSLALVASASVGIAGPAHAGDSQLTRTVVVQTSAADVEPRSGRVHTAPTRPHQDKKKPRRSEPRGPLSARLVGDPPGESRSGSGASDVPPEESYSDPEGRRGGAGSDQGNKSGPGGSGGSGSGDFGDSGSGDSGSGDSGSGDSGSGGPDSGGSGSGDTGSGDAGSGGSASDQDDHVDGDEAGEDD